MPGNEQPVAIVMLFMHFFPVEQGFQRKNRRAFPLAGTPVNRNNRFHDKLMSFAPLLPNGRRLKIEKRRELSVYLLRGIANSPPHAMPIYPPPLAGVDIGKHERSLTAYPSVRKIWRIS